MWWKMEPEVRGSGRTKQTTGTVIPEGSTTRAFVENSVSIERTEEKVDVM